MGFPNERDGEIGPDDLRMSFIFVPHGEPEPLEWMAEHPGWVKFPAVMVPRSRAEPPEAPIPARRDVSSPRRFPGGSPCDVPSGLRKPGEACPVDIAGPSDMAAFVQNYNQVSRLIGAPLLTAPFGQADFQLDRSDNAVNPPNLVSSEKVALGATSTNWLPECAPDPLNSLFVDDLGSLSDQTSDPRKGLIQVQGFPFFDPLLRMPLSKPPEGVFPRYMERIPRLSGKEGATDIPSWARGARRMLGETPRDFARRLMDDHFGRGNWSETGRDFQKLKKFGARSFQDPRLEIILPFSQAEPSA